MVRAPRASCDSSRAGAARAGRRDGSASSCTGYGHAAVSTIPSPARAVAISRSNVSVRVLVARGRSGRSVAPMTLMPSRSPRRQTPIPNERTTRIAMRWSSGPVRSIARSYHRGRRYPRTRDGSDPHGREGARRAHPRRSRGRGRGVRAADRARDGARRRRSRVGRLHPAEAQGDASRSGSRRATCACPATTSEEELLGLVAELNADDAIDGILVQLPLPGGIDEGRVIRAVDPVKDVDGFHPVNAGPPARRHARARAGHAARRAWRCSTSTRSSSQGANAVVIGRSDIVGKPAALLLLHRHATVTVCHSRTRDLAAEVSRGRRARRRGRRAGDRHAGDGEGRARP